MFRRLACTWPGTATMCRELHDSGVVEFSYGTWHAEDFIFAAKLREGNAISRVSHKDQSVAPHATLPYHLRCGINGRHSRTALVVVHHFIVKEPLLLL